MVAGRPFQRSWRRGRTVEWARVTFASRSSDRLRPRHRGSPCLRWLCRRPLKKIDGGNQDEGDYLEWNESENATTRTMGEAMRTLRLLRLAALLALALVGCRDDNMVDLVQVEPPPPPPSTAVVTVIDTKAGRFTAPYGAMFTAIFAPEGPLYSLRVDGRNATERRFCQITINLTAEQVEAETAEAQLGPGTDEHGGGEITSGPEDWTPEQLVRSTSGTVSVTFGQGQVQGTATAVPDELSGTFQSPSLGVGCLVTPAMLVDAGGTIPDAGGAPTPITDSDASLWVGVQDTDLVTPFCATLRHLRVP